MKEYRLTTEELKSIIEENKLIENAINFISDYYKRSDFDEYDVAKTVWDDIRDILKKKYDVSELVYDYLPNPPEILIADKVWWSEDCNIFLFDSVKETMKQN